MSTTGNTDPINNPDKNKEQEHKNNPGPASQQPHQEFNQGQANWSQNNPNQNANQGQQTEHHQSNPSQNWEQQNKQAQNNPVNQSADPNHPGKNSPSPDYPNKENPVPNNPDREKGQPFKIYGNWNKQSDQLKEKYNQLTDSDLKYEPGKENDLLERVGTRLNKNREEVIDILNRFQA